MSPARRPRGLPRGVVSLGGSARRVRLASGEEISRRQALALRGIVPEALAARPRRPQHVADLAPRDRGAYGGVVEVLHEMRGGLSLTAALAAANEGRARGQRLTVERLRALAGPAVRREGGRWRASVHDTLPRQLRLLGPDGPAVVEVRGSRIAATIARYEGALGRWAAGHPEALRRLRGRSVRLADGRRVALTTDEGVLRKLARAGLLGLPDGLYEPLAAA